MNQFLQQFSLVVSGEPSTQTVMSTLIFSFLLGLTVSFVYKRTHSGFSYSSSFTFTLVMTCVIVSVIMMVIGSNIALSLGLIGSLSIIRFRTVVKDTKDMAYLFWVIAMGLAVGAGTYSTALVSGFFIGLMVIILNKIKFARLLSADYVMILHLAPRGNFKTEEKVRRLFEEHRIESQLRSSLTDKDLGLKELTFALQHKKRREVFDRLLEELDKIKGVKKVSLLTPETNLFV